MANFTFNSIAVSGIATALPETMVQAASFADKFGEETVNTWKKTSGVESFYRADALQTASDMGFVAARKLLDKKQVNHEDIGVILFLSKTPDYRSPATSIVLQKRLNVPTDCLAYDINMGSNGFIYGLQTGCSLLESLNKKYALIVVGDTTSKQIAENDPISLTYGDGTSVILLEKKENAQPIHVETYTDGTGFKSYLVPGGAFRNNNLHETLAAEGVSRSAEHIYVNHEEMQNFALSRVPGAVSNFMQRHNKSFGDYNFVAFQQYSGEVLRDITAKFDMSYDDLPVNLDKYGNTAGNSIPLLLSDHLGGGKKSGDVHVLAVGFGEGFSWGVADFHVAAEDVMEITFTSEVFDDGHVTHEMSV
jgi:3-oxoacyl-[acyl-carrier-protein] synthase-3